VIKYAPWLFIWQRRHNVEIILAADTSTGVNSIALFRGAALLAECALNTPKRHAERMVAVTANLLDEAEISLHDVDLFAIATGPGSFTGLRIGVATWKGFAFGCGKPLLGVPSLDAFARASGIRDGVLCVALDAKMKEVYGAVYRVRRGEFETLCPMRVCPIGALLEAAPGTDYFAGDGALLYREEIVAHAPNAQFLAETHQHPHAAAVAELALAQWRAGDPGDAGAVKPVYLRQSQPEEALKLKNAAAP